MPIALPAVDTSADPYEHQVVPSLKHPRDSKTLQNILALIEHGSEGTRRKMLKVLAKIEARQVGIRTCGAEIDPDTGESFTCVWAPMA